MQAEVWDQSFEGQQVFSDVRMMLDAKPLRGDAAGEATVSDAAFDEPSEAKAR